MRIDPDFHHVKKFDLTLACSRDYFVVEAQVDSANFKYIPCKNHIIFTWSALFATVPINCAARWNDLKASLMERLVSIQRTLNRIIFGYNSIMYCSSSIQPKRHSGNVFLIGMMGAGKTTVGRLLAQQMGKIFVDSDEVIQKRTGVTIPHIFDVEGEAGFRQREASIIQELVLEDNIILATGGGAILNEQSRVALRSNGIVVYLKSTVHDLWQRTRHDRNRPLLQTSDPYTKLRSMYEQRDPIYSQMADLVMFTSKQSAQSLALHLQEELGRIWEK